MMYNTSVNVIASIPDFNLIIDVIGDYAHGKSKDYVYDRIFNQNIYGIRTGKSRSRFLSAINDVFLKFKSDNHKIIFYSLFKHSELQQIKKMSLYFQFSINNKLFFDLSTNVFVKLYQAGRFNIDKSEFISYIHDLKVNNQEIQKWSDSTIDIIGSKYLTFMKKIDFLKGRTKKEFNRITIDDSTIVYFIYLIKALGESSSDILKSPYIPLLMSSQQNLINRIKKISMVDYFVTSTLGYDLKIDLKYNYEEIVDVIAQRYESQV